ncbi:MAG: hypothetical protein IJH50_02455 [Kiritimatiellae bacterium]|nr:hypothetical protein [Kiritimatiellia bacterium]
MKKLAVLTLVAVALAAVALWICTAVRSPATGQADLEREFERMEPNDKELLDDFKGDIPLEVAPGKKGKAGARAARAKAGKAAADGDDEPAEEPTEEEKAEAEAEKIVEEFDALTDKWMETSSGDPPTLAEVDAFVELFRKVPADRKDECIHRALNLIPDENVMLLAGVLMDKGQDPETIDTVFSDILNREEAVKLPVLREVIKDTKHPCWKDAAWILDVTKQLPDESPAQPQQ